MYHAMASGGGLWCRPRPRPSAIGWRARHARRMRGKTAGERWLSRSPCTMLTKRRRVTNFINFEDIYFLNSVPYVVQYAFTLIFGS